MRIINIIESLDKGAVENWLVNVFIESRKTRPGWQWTFYCILGREGRLDEKVRQAGGNIIYSPCTISNKWKFVSFLRKTLKHGRYDIIHSHHDFLSGFYLTASFGISFKKRILQIHNTDEALPVASRSFERILRRPLKRLALYFSDLVVGISKDTLAQFIGAVHLSKQKTVVLYYGIDLCRFDDDTTGNALRSQLNLPAGSKLILFSGRMNAAKNPVFVIDILNELLKNDKSYYALFAGEGDLERDVLKKAEQYGIDANIKVLGWRTDLPFIMKSCDVFVFPRAESPKEGLGLVVVEAQAAGLPMVLSNGIVEDAIELPELATFISLNNNPAEWAGKVQQAKRTISQEQSLKKMKQSKFTLPIATANLIKLYEN